MPYNVPRHTGLAAYSALERARASAMKAAARCTAKLLEQQGRGGDRHLVHVNDRELAAIRGAFGPSGGAGRRNPATGLESFAPDDEAANTDDPFIGTSPGGSSCTMRLPLDTAPADARAAAEFNLTRIKPGVGASEPQPDFAAIPEIVEDIGGANKSPSATINPSPDQSPHSAAPSPRGVPVVLPNGKELRVRVPPDNLEESLYSPVADLAPVAQTVKRIGQVYRSLLSHPSTAAFAAAYLGLALGINHGQAGIYDYQREGNFIQGYKQLRDFRNVANFNIGLSAQQAGLPLEDVLQIPGAWARLTSSNAGDDPYSPNTPNAALMRQGYDIGKRYYSPGSSP